jgi:hypothetical protein
VLLTLPFELAARIAATPSFIVLDNGKAVAGFRMVEPEFSEIPAIIVATASPDRKAA